MPIYSGEHSITFGEKNTWDDWHLIPSSRPVFSPPQPNIRLLNIPGKSGSLDVTDVFGPVVYADRAGSFEFYVDHETEGCPWENWSDAYSAIGNYIHGQKMKAYLKDDPDWYYEGRFSLNEWRSNANFSTIVINYTVQPYKMLDHEYGDDWLWDPCDFTDSTTTVLSRFKGIDPQPLGKDGILCEIDGSGYRTIPTIVCTEAGVKLYFDNYPEVQLQKGENRPSIAVITPGHHTLRFVGSGYIDVHYRPGSI